MRRVSEASFFTDDARKRVGQAVGEAESRTAAEVVVVVRHTSGAWRQVDLAVGAVTAFAALLVLLFYPMPFAVETMPLDVLVAFVAGALVCASVSPLKRALLPRKHVAAHVRARAREAFVDQGISRTRGRTGILVYVSTFERRVELVADVGVDGKLLEAQERALADSIRRGPDLDAFLEGIRSIGPALAASLPRAEDDVNELPDAPVMT
jgi:putative membrane protein